MTSSTQAFRNLLANEIKYTRASLAEKAEKIAQDMMVLARRLRDEGDVTVSEFGELGQKAHMLDATCVRYAVSRQALKDLDSLAMNLPCPWNREDSSEDDNV